MSSRLKLRPHQKRRSGKPYERKSVLEKVKNFFTPSYWFGSEGATDDDDAMPHAEDEARRHIFNPPYSHPSDSSQARQNPQGDDIIIDGTQSDRLVPSLSVGTAREKSSEAWKRNMISLNEDIETGPSQISQNEAGSSVTSSSESTSVNALHNTKLFIPASLNAPQHSTPLKMSDQISTQSGSDSTSTNVLNEMDTLPKQLGDTAAETRKESTPSSSAVAPRFELHQHGSMLTPPDSPAHESSSAGNRSRTQSHLTSMVSPGRFNIPQGQGPLRSPYYSGRTTFGGASSQVKMRTVKRRRFEDDQRSPELPPVRQQLHARPATHQTVVASQTAKQILESLKNYSTPVSNAKRFPIRSPVPPLMSPKESVVPAAKRHRIKPTSADKQHGQVSGPPVNPLLTPYKAHIMTLPPVTPPTDDRLHSNPITMTTAAQPTSTHSSEPHPLVAASSMNPSSLSSTAPGLLSSNVLSTSEVARVKEKPQDVTQPISEGFSTGWVGGASGKIKEKKYSMHEGNKDDEQINPMEMPKAIPLQLSSSGKLPSFTFTPAFVQKKGKSDNSDNSNGTMSKETDRTSGATGMGVAYNFSQPKTITTATVGSKPTTSGKELVKFSFSTPKQHEAAPAVSSISLPMSSVPPKVSLPTQFNLLPSTQPLLLRSAAIKSTSERKPLPLKSGSCLDILKPSKPPVEDKTVNQSKPPPPASESSTLSQMFKPAEGSSTCMINNKTTEVSTTSSTTATTAPALTSIPQQSSLSQKFKPAEGSWECPTCMINNKTTDSNCVACTTSRPGGTLSATTAAGALTTSSAPQQSSLSQKFKPAEGSWECPTCMINNKTTDSNCVACTTSRPGGPASTPAASSGLSKGMTLGSGTGLQFGSSGGMKLEAMKDGGMLKVSSTGGFKLGPSSGFNLGSGLKSESTAVGEPATGGFKLEPSGGFKLGVSGGFKLGSSGDLKLGSGGDLKLGSSNDSKLVDKNTINLDSGGKGLKLSSSSALQLGSANSSNLLPSSSIIITTTITSGFTSSSIVSQSLSSRPGSALSTSSAEGNTSAPAPGIKFGGLIGSHSLSSGSSGGDNLKPTLLSGQQSSAQLTLKPLDAGTASTDSSGLKIGSSSGGLELRTSGGLQLGASGGLKLGASGGLQLGSGGFQSGSSSSGFKLGLPTNIQPVSGEAIKLTSGNISVTHDTEGIKLGKKRPIDNVEEEGASNVEPVNKSLLGIPVVLPPLNKPAVATAKSVTFKLDGDNTNSDNVSINKQASFGTPQPSLVAGSGVLTSAGFTLGGSSTGDSKLPSLTNESSATKPFANLFSNSSTTNSSVINFGFPKLTSMSTLATTSASTLQAAPLSGMSSVTTTAADQAKLFNFSQQALFAAPGQGQSRLSGGLDLKLPTCQESKNISGNVTFNFSGAKSNELSQGQQGLSTGLGLTQATSQPGFNFHAAMQNQGGSIFSGSVGSGLSGSSTTNSGLFTDQLGTNQADNASGMEISNPATGEPQHLSNLTGLGGQGLQLQFGNNSNTTQPFIFNSNTNQPNMFEGNSSNVFGANNSVLGNELPANMIFSASPSIAARPMKKAKRRYPK